MMGVASQNPTQLSFAQNDEMVDSAASNIANLMLEEPALTTAIVDIGVIRQATMLAPLSIYTVSPVSLWAKGVAR